VLELFPSFVNQKYGNTPSIIIANAIKTVDFKVGKE